MILLIDTETSGAPLWKLPSEDQSQPFIVEIAMIELDDATFEEVDVFHAIVKPPDGRSIPPEMTEIHGITQEKAFREGTHGAEIAKLYSRKRKAASAMLAHNIPFDIRMMRIEMLRYGAPKEHCDKIEEGPQLCTQKIMTPVVKMPPTEAMKKYPGLAKRFKSASLDDCMNFCFGGAPLAGAHGALEDARNCGRIYRWARDNGHIK